MKRFFNAGWSRWLILGATTVLSILPGACTNDILRLATPFLI